MDINTSANTLFHFTSTPQNLLNILKNGLYIRYSLENYGSLTQPEAKDAVELAFPMLCFCDIPLSHVKKHTKTYGKYAIGLSKYWGAKNGINPVIYTHSQSSVAITINIISDELQEITKIEAPRKKQNNQKSIMEILQTFSEDEFRKYSSEVQNRVYSLQMRLIELIKFIKPYNGKTWREDGYENVKFYDEREWRFVPSDQFLMEKGLKTSYKKEYYIDKVKRRAINIKLAKHLKLEIKPDDIRFIIVDKENEIPEFIEEIERISYYNVSAKKLKILTTRLISLDQIIEDL